MNHKILYRGCVLSSLWISLAAYGQTGDMSFTPTGFKYPIVQIQLAKNKGTTNGLLTPSNNQVIYTCSAGTSAGCLVDVTSQTALDAITAAAQNVSVANGTYDMVILSPCPSTATASTVLNLYVKGSFTTGGTTYYTDATSTNTSGLTSSGSTADFTTIASVCADKQVLLPTPVVVGTTTTASPSPSPSASATSTLSQTLNVLVDNTFLANSSSTNTSGMGGCKAPSGGGRGICVNIPAILPYVGTATVTTKRFKMAHNSTSAAGIVDSKANAIIIVPLAGTTPLTIFAGPYFSETSAAASSNTSAPTDTTYGGPCYNTATDLTTFKVNADSTIKFTQGASADAYSGAFSAFQSADHNGTLTTQSGATTWYYHAIAF